MCDMSENDPTFSNANKQQSECFPRSDPQQYKLCASSLLSLEVPPRALLPDHSQKTLHSESIAIGLLNVTNAGGFVVEILSGKPKRRRSSIISDLSFESSDNHNRSKRSLNQMSRQSSVGSLSYRSDCSNNRNRSQRSLQQEDDLIGFPDEEIKHLKMERRSSVGSQLSQWSVNYGTNRRDKWRAMLVKSLRASVQDNILRRDAAIEKVERQKQWLKSFHRLDPRNQIMVYFDEVARQGGPLENPLAPPPEIFNLLRGFAKAAAFTVWRPTSRESIRKMMTGEATGKGLDVKGKSAKCGSLSALVPFVQIHDNEHKKKVLRPPKYGRVRIYFKSSTIRNFAMDHLISLSNEMKKEFDASKRVLSSKHSSEDEREEAMEKYILEVRDPNIYALNDSGYGLDAPERVFFEASIMRQDLRRTGELVTGRPSRPEFQEMNCASIRKYSGDGPRPVILQTSLDPLSALRPQTLVIAYDEDNRVTPVASDFDCFTIGTRGVAYDIPMPTEQIDLMKWLIGETDAILKSPISEKTWTSHWLDVMKNSSRKLLETRTPKYGFGDPKSSSIIEGAVARFRHNKNGAVRHAAECFNYTFPQEIDDYFLVVSDSLPGKVPWKYVDKKELIELLCEKIDEDFCFPINPKWILADKGWKKIWDKMIASSCSNTIQSCETWYPKKSGIREMIEAIHQNHPNGFERVESQNPENGRLHYSGSTEMALAQWESRRQLILRRVRFKIKIALMFGKLGGKVLRESDDESKKRLIVNEFRKMTSSERTSCISLGSGSWWSTKSTIDIDFYTGGSEYKVPDSENHVSNESRNQDFTRVRRKSVTFQLPSDISKEDTTKERSQIRVAVETATCAKVLLVVASFVFLSSHNDFFIPIMSWMEHLPW